MQISLKMSLVFSIILTASSKMKVLLNKLDHTSYLFKYHSSFALNLCNHLFSALLPLVLEWSPTKEQFLTSGNTCPKYWLWYFTTIIFSCAIGFGSCIDVISHHKQSGISLSILSFGFASMSFRFFASAAVITWHVDEIVAGLGNLHIAYQHLSNLFCFILCSILMQRIYLISLYLLACFKSRPTKRLSSDFQWIIITYILKQAIFTMIIFPTTLTPLALWVKMDPFSCTFPKLFCPHNCTFISKLILLFLREICTLIYFTEVCHFVAL